MPKLLQVRADREVIMAAVRKDRRTQELRCLGNAETLLTLCVQVAQLIADDSDDSAFRVACEASLWSCTSQDGMALAYASQELQDDEAVVEAFAYAACE